MKTIGLPLQTIVENQSVCLFLKTFPHAGSFSQMPAYLRFLPIVFLYSQMDSCLHQAGISTAAANLGNYSNLEHHRLRIRSQYSRALRALYATLRDPALYSVDSTLTAIWLLRNLDIVAGYCDVQGGHAYQTQAGSRIPKGY